MTAEARLEAQVLHIVRRVPIGNTVTVESIVAELSDDATEPEVLDALYKLQGQRHLVHIAGRTLVRRLGVVKAGA